MSNRILIVDEDDSLRAKIETLLSAENCEVVGATGGRAALHVIESSPIDIILSNSRARGIDGLDLLPQLSVRMPGTPIILLCDSGEGDLAGQALRRGAYDSLTKPLESNAVLLALGRAQERVQLAREDDLARRDLQRVTGDPPIVATSPAMIELLEVIERAAPFKSAILLTGERGSGKEALARAVHSQSPRRQQAFVPVNCGRSREPGFESDFVGQASGSRRGLLAESDGGTLYLNEVGELPETIQEQLLRLLQEEAIQPLGDNKPCPVDVRLIATTSRDLEAEVAAGSFREDLYYRLNVVHLAVPPLRERPRDIPLLFDHFRAHFSGLLDKSTQGITDDALAHLVAYRWPGNIRELANVVERAVLLASGDHITLTDLPEELTIPDPDESGSEPPHNLSLKAARKSFEAEMIQRALRATHGNRTHAAKRLGISHRGLLYKIKEYRIRD